MGRTSFKLTPSQMRNLRDARSLRAIEVSKAMVYLRLVPVLFPVWSQGLAWVYMADLCTILVFLTLAEGIAP